MISFHPKMKSFALLAVLLPALVACGVNSGDNNMGRLSLSLTDKPTNTVRDVYITIKQIDVHAVNDTEDVWKTVLTLNETYKITDLTGGLRKQLGIVNLDPGHYDQLRLIIGTEPTGTHTYANWVTIPGEQPDTFVDYELKIPSGAQTGIKFIQGFDINEGSTTELTFDFDANRSIVVAGNKGKYLLKPVIHVIYDDQTRLVIKGTVKDNNGLNVVGATVSLQVFDAVAAPENQIASPYTTTTDSTGAYQFWFLNVPTPTTYNLVATDWPLTPNPTTPPPYGAAWNQVPDAANDATGNPFTDVNFVLPVLAAEKIGTFNVLVSGAQDATTEVTLSFRQVADTLANTPDVEVFSIKYVNNTQPYVLTLPVGNYTIVASTLNKTTQVIPAAATPRTFFEVKPTGTSDLTVAF